MSSKRFSQKVAEAPAIAVETAIEMTQAAGRFIDEQQPVKEAQEFWRNLGPGLTTGAADDDPSGIATYSQAGAAYGFQYLWLAAFTFPLMAAVQEMCARMGMVTGEGLAANIRRYFPAWVLYTCTILLFIANTFNLGADLGAMAKAMQLLNSSWNFGTLILIFAVLSLGLQIFTTYENYAKYLKWLALILLSYVVTALVIPNVNWSEIVRASVTPSIHFTKESVLLICGILGTTISPYLFFWQTSQEVEEEILSGKTTVKQRQALTTNEEIKNMRVDVWSGMFLSNLVMFFIITVCGLTLFRHGITNITTAADAAAALRPLAGDKAFILFALGIIGTGMLAVPVLAGSAAYALAETFRWKTGLYRQLRQAQAFYGVIILSVVIGFAMNFIHLDPIKALIYSAVGNGLVAPVVLVLIVLISSNKKIMGEHVNRPFTTVVGWVITGIMVLAGVAAIGSLL